MPDTQRIPVTPEQARELIDGGYCGSLWKAFVKNLDWMVEHGYDLYVEFRSTVAELNSEKEGYRGHICVFSPARARKYLEAMGGRKNIQ